MTKHSPFCDFKTSPCIMRIAIMLYLQFPLLLSNVEDLLNERGAGWSRKGVGESYGRGYQVEQLHRWLARAVG